MKATHRCPKCASLKVGHLDMQVDMVGAYGTTAAVAAVGITEDAKKSGMFEAWVCAACGYYETYVKSPSTVPFEKMKGFRWMNPGADDAGVYR